MIERRRNTNSWRSRRFWQTNGIIILATFLCYFSKLDGVTWAATVVGAAGWYAQKNSTEKLAIISAPQPEQPKV